MTDYSKCAITRYPMPVLREKLQAEVDQHDVGQRPTGVHQLAEPLLRRRDVPAVRVVERGRQTVSHQPMCGNDGQFAR